MNGFIEHSFDDGMTRPVEYLPAAADLSVNVGTALVFTDGLLTIAAGATAPAYICKVDRAATVAGEILPVVRAGKDLIFETSLSEAAATIKRGGKHTISADGNRITATTTGGVAEVVAFDGTAAGSLVRVRF